MICNADLEISICQPSLLPDLALLTLPPRSRYAKFRDCHPFHLFAWGYWWRLKFCIKKKETARLILTNASLACIKDMPCREICPIPPCPTTRLTMPTLHSPPSALHQQMELQPLRFAIATCQANPHWTGKPLARLPLHASAMRKRSARHSPSCAKKSKSWYQITQLSHWTNIWVGFSLDCAQATLEIAELCRFLYVIQYYIGNGFYVVIDYHAGLGAIESDRQTVSNPSIFQANWQALLTAIQSLPTYQTNIKGRNFLQISRLTCKTILPRDISHWMEKFQNKFNQCMYFVKVWTKKALSPAKSVYEDIRSLTAYEIFFKHECCAKFVQILCNLP